MRVEIFSRAIRSDKSRWGEREREEGNSWRSSGGGTKESSIVRSKRLLREKRERSLVGLEEQRIFLGDGRERNSGRGQWRGLDTRRKGQWRGRGGDCWNLHESITIVWPRNERRQPP